ncbi:MAG: twin-arginine translocase subunit TatC [Oligoflexia bacterium]|nr:twin-arginine translocase subunit TatC [Oligoflexia bacterium]
MIDSEGPQTQSQVMTIAEHLSDLRVRLITTAYILLGGFALCYGFSEYIFNFLRDPIVPYLPAADKGLHFTGPFEKFMAHMKVSFLAGVILTSPLWLYQIWKFIAPGLYLKEKKYAAGFVFSGISLFVGGSAFAYYVVLPFAFKFLLGFGGTTDTPMITISEYIDFILKFFLAFGITFELPVILVFLGIMGVIDHQFLIKNRRYAIVVLAVISAVVTPPDALSMLALLIPLVILYEISVVLVRVLTRKTT